MRRILVALTFTAALLAANAAATTAAPFDATRAADGELRFCPEGYKCTARGVGDFNGDGSDDLAFEIASVDADGQLPPVRGHLAVPRRIELLIGPFTADGSGGVLSRPTSRAAVYIHAAQPVDPFVVADLNDDGRDDLLVPRGPSAGHPMSELTVVLGRASWPRAMDIDAYDEGILRLRRAPLPLLDAVSQGVAVADLNGDARTDLAWSTTFADRTIRGATTGRVHIQFGAGAWEDVEAFEADTTVTGLGNCSHGVAGTGDATGDGFVDLVVRRCDEGLPTELRVLAGRAAWPSEIDIGGNVNVPTPVPGVPPPRRGGGYLPAPGASTETSDPVFVEDIDGDGIADIGLEFADKTHIWHGGHDIAARVAANRSSGVFLKADTGAMQLTRSWRMLDLDADGGRDLLLSEPIDDALLACERGVCARGGDVGGAHVFVYSDGAPRVLDAELVPPDAIWRDRGQVLWAAGDFNGDGADDMMLGSSPGALDSVYSLVYGPLARTSLTSSGAGAGPIGQPAPRRGEVPTLR